jgi:hypothetical protein
MILSLVACTSLEHRERDVGLAVATVVEGIAGDVASRAADGPNERGDTTTVTFGEDSAEFTGSVAVSVTWGRGHCDDEVCDLEASLTLAPDVLFRGNTLWGRWDADFGADDGEIDWDPPDFALTADLTVTTAWDEDPGAGVWTADGEGTVSTDEPVEGQWPVRWSQSAAWDDSGENVSFSGAVGGASVVFVVGHPD